MNLASEAEIYAFLREVFADILGRDDIELTPELTAADVEGWDSHRHIEILIATQEHYGLKFSTRELDSLASLGDLVKIVKGKTQNR